MESKYKSFDELPLMLSVVQVAEVLGISKTSAYELSHKEFSVNDCRWTNNCT